MAKLVITDVTAVFFSGLFVAAVISMAPLVPAERAMRRKALVKIFQESPGSMETCREKTLEKTPISDFQVFFWRNITGNGSMNECDFNMNVLWWPFLKHVVASTHITWRVVSVEDELSPTVGWCFIRIFALFQRYPNTGGTVSTSGIKTG